jgi:hypothetical protein
MRKTATAAIKKVTIKPIVPGELYWSSGTGIGVTVTSAKTEYRKFMAQVFHLVA